MVVKAMVRSVPVMAACVGVSQAFVGRLLEDESKEAMILIRKDTGYLG